MNQSPIIRITHESPDLIETTNEGAQQLVDDVTISSYDQTISRDSSVITQKERFANLAKSGEELKNLDCKTSGAESVKSTISKTFLSDDEISQRSKTIRAGDYGSKNSNHNVGEGQTHAFKRRFFVLALFCAHSAVNSFQWIQFSSITNIIADYYGASNIQVNFTSLVYMITYIPFIIHASLMLERVGLRKAIFLGTLGTSLGSFIKWQLGGQPEMNSFWWMMLGQTIVALSQLYIISIPPLLAAVWFPDNQVSTATGIGVFGNQLGIALGFIIPPWVISNPSGPKEIIGADLNSLACAIFYISLVICIISAFAIEDKPPKPPGSASLHAAHQHEQASQQMKTQNSIKELYKDEDFRYLIFSYGINVGCFYAVSTILNQMVATRWPTQVDLAGKMGLLIVVSGMLGSVLCGQVLDRTHAYKLTIVLIYLLSLASMLLFTLVLRVFTQTWPIYLASITLGFFMTGYLPLGFEFAAEITYPHPANTPAGLLNLSAQVFGLVLTYVSSVMVDGLGDLLANSFLTLCLAAGLALTAIMKADLKRQEAVAKEQMKV